MLLSSNLTQKIITILQSRITISSVNLWTDSQIALCWCKSQASRWTVFVANRVSKIQSLTSNYQWRHVRSADNPADILSRGKFSPEVHHMWFNGPDFLNDINSDFSQFESIENIDDLPEERKITLTIISDKNTFWQNTFSNFSSFLKLHRTVAYILRFIHNLRDKENKFIGPLSVNELNASLTFIIKQIQNHSFSKEITELSNNKNLSNKQLISLTPILDQSGLLRVGGRLKNAEINFDQKHPILLPSKNHVTYLILKHQHERLGHAGGQNVLSNVRLRYWPLNGLRQIKHIIRNCKTCYRFNSRTAQQIMTDLPKDRVTYSRPFQKVGIDFGGPFFIKSSHLRKAPVTKCYISIFVCMVTKAVHIELVSSLTTEAFIATLKRFVARRGNPTIIYSDNATNFLGARNQLKELYNKFQDKDFTDSIQNYLSQNETQWKFIPPRSPHWGGIWEAAIKSTKYHIIRLIGVTKLTFEQFSTILAQIEAILNSRPLSALSNDPTDYQYLTPGHFLIGSSLTAYPEKDLSNSPENRIKFWEQCSRIQQLFWKKWSIDYLNRLQNKPKWFKSSENLQKNDLVLLKEENMPPLRWPMARVIKPIVGPDGKVRVVRLKTKTSEFTRAITKLCPIPKQDNMSCEDYH
jgi:Family of unknown function (DUF5641)/Integrase zinc binding domain/Integrase core domain